MNRQTVLVTGITLITLSLAGACRLEEKRPADTTGVGATAGSLEGPRSGDTTRRERGLRGANDEGPIGSSDHRVSAVLMDSMETTLRRMEGIGAVQMTTIIPARVQLVARLLSELDADRRRLKLAPDAAWEELTDSVEHDLEHMPRMEASKLRILMADHHQRVDRLITMHRRVVGETTK